MLSPASEPHSVTALFQAMEDEMQARHSHLQSVIQASQDLIEAGNFGAEKIQERIDEINQQWESLIDLATYRKKRLNEAVDFYQVRTMFRAFPLRNSFS